MKHSIQHRLTAVLLCTAAALVPTLSAADDIDIFVGASAGSAAYPKILIILDNTSNWSRASQGWPGGIVQGQAEVAAINTVLGSIGSNVNMGLMEFVTAGTATQDGGYIRQAIVPMTTANVSAFGTRLSTIYNNITSPSEKLNSGTPYGDLMYDAYKYFNGLNCLFPTAVPTSLADVSGYTTPYTTFNSPLSDANACGNNYIIFIGNPDASGPSADSTANGTALTGLGGTISPQILVPGFTSASTTIATNLAYTSQCYGSLASCSTTDNTYNATQCSSGTYASCSCSNTLTTTSLDACASGTQRYSVIGNIVTGGTSTSTTTVTAKTATAPTTSCYASSGAASTAGDHGGMTLPSTPSTTSGNTTTVYTNSGDTYTYGGIDTTASASCPATTGSYTLQNTIITTGTAQPTTSCYNQNGTGTWTVASGDFGTQPACPATSTTTSGSTSTRNSYTCSYSGVQGASCSGTGNKYHFNVTQTVTENIYTAPITQTSKFTVTQSYNQTAVATTTTGSTTTQTPLGNTSQCYATGSAATAEFVGCTNGTYSGGCTSGPPTASAGLCSSGARYMVTGNNVGTVVTPTGTFAAPAKPTSGTANADEWARFMHQPKSCNQALDPTCTTSIKQSITTYTIDVFNAQQNADATSLYMSMARVGGGKYFAATNQSQIVAALQSILAEIQSVNTTFASASLPVNATNRTQNANQVFIGMFRPDPQANPRWYGNLKQYQIGNVNGTLDLVDVNGAAATNLLTGFIADCAVSFWTSNSVWPTNSSNYWANIVDNPDPASNCIGSSLSTLGGAVYSDLPDGPTVEKGAVAEVLRKGNNPSATPTWQVNRNMYTFSGGALAPFNATNAPSLSSSLLQFTQGIDVNNATGLYNSSTNPYQTRPGIHGDVVHSRPLPINYGNGVTVFYGANDGSLRAVDSSNGQERWAYVAPEHFAKLQRLMSNSPPVDYHLGTAGTTPKDYFFDGSIGVYQAPAVGTNPPVWIYPTQRRGGRMVYAFDVSSPASPTLKWRHGCVPNPPGADTCDSGYSAIGQTWSTPNVAFINGYSTATTKPVVVVGGGYDSCEDADAVITTQCSSTTGNAVYLIDADTGALIVSFPTTRAVAADVTLIDINNDGLVDYGYVADVGGNIYRIDFVPSPTNPTSGSTSGWNMHRVAYTNASGQGRKFLFGPGLFPTGTSAYVAIVSGDREHPLITDYPYTSMPYPNKAYVYKDDLTSTASTAAVNLDGSDMMNVTDASTSTCTSDNLLTKTDKKGWFMYLNQYGTQNANGVTGEQGVTSAVIVGGMVTFSTNRPLSSGLACSTRLGEARGYFVNLFNGSGTINTTNNAACGGVRSSTFAGGGLPPSPVVGIVPINGVPTAVLIGAPSRDGGANSPIRPTKITPPINQSRKRTYKYIKGDS